MAHCWDLLGVSFATTIFCERHVWGLTTLGLEKRGWAEGRAVVFKYMQGDHTAGFTLMQK